MRLFTSILFVIVIFSGQMTFAQAKKSSDDILKEVSEKTKAFSSIQINFTYNMDNPTAKVHESQTGTLLIKGDQYRLDISGQKVICDGKTVWTYIAESKEVQINAVDENEKVLTPTRLLTSYNKDYKSKLAGEVTKDGRAQYVIDLKPNADKSYTGVELNVDKELSRITRIAIQDKSGNTFSYSVNKFEPNVPASDADFVFNAKDYPGVEVIDMR